MAKLRIPLLCLLLVISLRSAQACSCSFPRPASCQGLSGPGPLFVGTVTDISEDPKAKEWLEQVRIRFRIDEVITGIKGDYVEVYTGNGGGDCSIRVEQGKQYLIDAGKDKNGKLKVIICSLTRNIESAAALLPQLRAMRDHEKPASLFGVVEEGYRGFDADFNDPYESHFMSNIVVRASSVERSFETVTDAGGAYAFSDIPASKYALEISTPSGWRAEETQVDLPANSCLEQNIFLSPRTKITGRVINERGQGVASADIELLPITRSSDPKFRGPWEMTGSDGSYKFQGPAPGDYYLVFNRRGRIDPDIPYGTTYFPEAKDIASARVVHLDLGQEIRKADIHVSGSLAVRELTVQVQWSNGVPAKDAFVLARASVPQAEISREEIGHGTWRVKLLQAVRYEISAEMICQVWGDTWSGPGKRFHTDVVTVPSHDVKPADIKLVLNGDHCPPGYTKGPPPQH